MNVECVTEHQQYKKTQIIHFAFAMPLNGCQFSYPYAGNDSIDYIKSQRI